MRYTLDIERNIDALEYCLRKVKNGIEDIWSWDISINAGGIDYGIYFNFDTERKELEICNHPGYGYNDIGREVIENIFADVLCGEDALVRSQFISGTHALTVALFAFLRPGDTILSITGKPYDTLDEVIGITENDSSLKSYNISYEQIDLINDDFNYEKIKETLKNDKIKLIEIQ